MLSFRDLEKAKAQNSIRWARKFGIIATHHLKQMNKRAGIKPHLTNHYFRATSVTVLSDHNCETRHINSVTGHKSDQAVKSYNERPSIEQQQEVSLVLSEFIADGSLSSCASMEKENETE